MIWINYRPALAGAALLLALGSVPLGAQQHRATHLGNPATRFAPPRQNADDLRRLFRDPALRPDIAAILRQWGWPGNLDDLYRAAETNVITELTLPVGTRMPFMASRAQGRPVALKDVLWAGREPVRAFAFTFSSNGRRYRCVTPAPCSNFYLEDLGSDLPKLSLEKTVPAEASLCQPFELKLTVRNTGPRPLAQVRVTDPLPAGLRTVGGRTHLDLDAGALAPGQAVQFVARLVAAAAGEYVNRAQAGCAEGATAEAAARTIVRGPALALSCRAPEEVRLGRPVEVCLALQNTGNAPEPRAALSLPLPPGATVVRASSGGVVSANQVLWDGLSLAPGQTQQLCAVFAAGRPGSLAFQPAARGACAGAVQAGCVTRIAGVPGLLLEVVDLEDPVEVGRRVIYTIKVVNQGSVRLTGLRLACSLPESQEFAAGTGASPVTADGRAVRMEPLAELAPKAEASWRVEAKALAPGDVRFQAELRCDQLERPVEETEATRQY